MQLHASRALCPSPVALWAGQAVLPERASGRGTVSEGKRECRPSADQRPQAGDQAPGRSSQEGADWKWTRQMLRAESLQAST